MPGVYYEHMVAMQDAVDLVGSGANVTVIDGHGQEEGAIVYANNIRDPTTTLQGFTVKNGGSGTYGVIIANSNIILERNIISNEGADNRGGGLGVGNDSNTIIRNNILLNNVNWGIFIGTGEKPLKIYNNIIMNSDFGISGIGGDTITPILLNNVFCGNIWNYSLLEVPSRNDLQGNINRYSAEIPGTNNISADPLFIDLTKGILYLQPKSPCINAGKDYGEPFYGTAPEIGVFEHTDEEPIFTGIGSQSDSAVVTARYDTTNGTPDLTLEGAVSLSDTNDFASIKDIQGTNGVYEFTLPIAQGKQYLKLKVSGN